MPKFGLIGYPLSHSFSKKYFTEKFLEMGISDTHAYELYPIDDVSKILEILRENKDMKGINVTIPYKQDIKAFLDNIDPKAEAIGAVNVIKVNADNTLTGYNSDYYGFQQSLLSFLGKNTELKALVLGNGGAAKAVFSVLKDLNISYKVVSRTPKEGQIGYAETVNYIPDYHLIINTSPVGTYPNVDEAPALDYSLMSSSHYLYDLVYNPAETQFMKNGLAQDAQVKNGYDMLVFQAEKSWEIWGE